jgi:hypothetical protein
MSSLIDPGNPSDVNGLTMANINPRVILAMVVVSMGLVALLVDIHWNQPPIPDASCALALDSTEVRGRMGSLRGYYRERGADGAFDLPTDLAPYAPVTAWPSGPNRGADSVISTLRSRWSTPRAPTR